MFAFKLVLLTTKTGTCFLYVLKTYHVFQYGAVNYIDFFENDDGSVDEMLRCMRKTMDNLKMDCERSSCFIAITAN